MTNNSYQIMPIGIVHSPYTQKFGIARQPGLVPAAKVCLELNHDIVPDAIRGLEEFEYIWLQFIFHGAIDEGWSALVRPPRLGGKTKKGVFATRSPHRPNHIGLSLLKLNHINIKKNTIFIYCEGADLLDQTPIVDIKPYIPFVEAKPGAKSGFVNGEPIQLNIIWQDTEFYKNNHSDLILIIEQSIAQDPRPAYQDIADRIYHMEIADKKVSFKIIDKTAFILTVE